MLSKWGQRQNVEQCREKHALDHHYHQQQQHEHHHRHGDWHATLLNGLAINLRGPLASVKKFPLRVSSSLALYIDSILEFYVQLCNVSKYNCVSINNQV